MSSRYTKSDRGFTQCPAIPGTYSGTVRVYESSSADPHIWVNIRSGALVQVEPDEGIVHLSHQQAELLWHDLDRLLHPSTPGSAQWEPVIDRFVKQYRFLSNFCPSAIYIEGIGYPTVEHAFQSLKMANPIDARTVREASTPGQAKQWGRKLAMRPNWEAEKVAVMRRLLNQKFAYGNRFAKLLDETGNAILIEGNNWGDCFWGECEGVGENLLGKLLMEIRAQNRGTAMEGYA